MKIIPVFILIILIGCGDDEVATISHTKLIEEGWKEYAAKNYNDAIIKFQEALSKDQNNPEALNGIGWSKAKLNQTADSINSFKAAITGSPSYVDAHAGIAGAYLATGDYERAIASGRLVLSLDPNYSSVHDKVNARDIRILLAEAYYNMGDYASAKNQIDLLEVPGKVLDPGSTTYLMDLLLVIEELSKKS